MTTPPRISVLMSTHGRNRPGWNCDNMLRRAVDSIRVQSMPHFEFIIIDDASSDGTQQVLEDYALKDSRIRLIRLHDNCKGYTATRYNRLFAEATAPYVHTMFDDDEMMPNAFDLLLDAVDAAPSPPAMVYGKNLWRSRVEASHYDGKTFGMPWPSSLRTQNIFCQQAALISVAALKTVGLFDTDPALARLVDWDLTLRVFEVGLPVVHIEDTVCTVYLFNEDSIGANIAVDFSKFHELRKPTAKIPSVHRLQARNFKIAWVSDHANERLCKWNIADISREMNLLGHTCRWIVTHGSSVMNSTSGVLDDDFVIYFRSTRIPLGEIETLQSRGILVGYSIDDALWMPNEFHFIATEAASILEICEKVDFLVFPNEKIASHFPSLKPKIVRKHMAMGSFEASALNPTSGLVARSLLPRKNLASFRVLAPKQGATGQLGKMLNDIFSELLKSDENIECHYFANRHFSLASKDPRVIRHDEVDPTSRFYDAVRAIDPDVILNPLPSGDFIDCKSEVKFLEATAFCAPLVSSPSWPNVKAIGTGTYAAGFLASTAEEFVEHVIALKKSPFLSARVVNRAWHRAEVLYNPKSIAREFSANLEVLSQSKGLSWATGVSDVSSASSKTDGHSPLPASGRKPDLVINPTLVASPPEEETPAVMRRRLFENATDSLLHPVTFGRHFDQTIPFATTCRSIHVRGHAYRARIGQPLRCDVMRQGSILSTGYIPAGQMQEGLWWPVSFAEPLSLVEGDVVRFTNQDKRPVSFFYSDYGSRKEAAAMRFLS
ncbi:MAG: glycosyltransferase family 2 protein [Luteolibacter sp.]